MQPGDITVDRISHAQAVEYADRLADILTEVRAGLTDLLTADEALAHEEARRLVEKINAALNPAAARATEAA